MPTPDTDRVHGPDMSGANAAVRRAEKSPAGTPGTGSPSHTAMVSRTVSVRSGVPVRSPAGK